MSTRDQLVAAGMALFGERGYAATAIADVQLACGLTAGSGALYKHFPSKQALLAEGVQRYVADIEKASLGLIGILPDDPRAALGMIAEAVTEGMSADRPIIRVVMRDLEQFPDLLGMLWDGVLAAVYRQITVWLSGQQQRGNVSVADPGATAAVLLASLTYYPILDALIGRAPGDVDRARFLAAWVDSASASIQCSVKGTR